MTNCEALDERANGVGAEVLKKTRDLHAAYDRVSGQGRYEGVVYPKVASRILVEPELAGTALQGDLWADIECDNRPLLRGQVDDRTVLAILDSGSSVAALTPALAGSSQAATSTGQVTLITGPADSARLDTNVTFTSGHRKFVLERPLVFDTIAPSSCARARPDVIVPAGEFARFDLYYSPDTGYSLLPPGGDVGFEATQTLQIGLGSQQVPFVVATIADDIVLLEVDTGAKSGLRLPEDRFRKEGKSSPRDQKQTLIRLGKMSFRDVDAYPVPAETGKAWSAREVSGLLGSGVLTRCMTQLSVESRLLSLGGCRN